MIDGNTPSASVVRSWRLKAGGQPAADWLHPLAELAQREEQRRHALVTEIAALSLAGAAGDDLKPLIAQLAKRGWLDNSAAGMVCEAMGVASADDVAQIARAAAHLVALPEEERAAAILHAVAVRREAGQAVERLLALPTAAANDSEKLAAGVALAEEAAERNARISEGRKRGQEVARQVRIEKGKRTKEAVLRAYFDFVHEHRRNNKSGRSSVPGLIERIKRRVQLGKTTVYNTLKAEGLPKNGQLSVEQWQWLSNTVGEIAGNPAI